MLNKDFNRYAADLVGVMNMDAAKRLRLLFTEKRHPATIDYKHPGTFITPLGNIELLGNPDLHKQVEELEKFLEESGL